MPEAAARRRELLDLAVRYRAAKRERDLLDFGDQIALSAELARTRPEVGALLRDEFRVVLLDEYQDTSVAQRILLSGLFGGGTGHPVTAVGDPCQAIYGWRGASVANLDDFPEHFPTATAARPPASPSARTAAAAAASSGSPTDSPRALRARHAGVEALRPAPGAERDGTVRIALLPTHAEEIAWLADSVAHLVRTGKAPGEIAVLCRTATDFPEIQAALVARDVPVEVVGLSAPAPARGGGPRRRLRGAPGPRRQRLPRTAPHRAPVAHRRPRPRPPGPPRTPPRAPGRGGPRRPR